MTTTWQPTGNVHRFDEAVIAGQVPEESGVYGLHTEHQQLFIGEAADLRAALLLHCRQSRKFFRDRQPTHVAFETCDARQRAIRAQALIAAHRPAVRAPQPFSLIGLPLVNKRAWNTPAAMPDARGANAEWPEAAPPTPVAAKYLSHSQLATLLLLSMVTAGVAGYLGVLAGQQIAERRNTVLQWAEYQRQAGRTQLAGVPESASATRDLTGGENASHVQVSESDTAPVQVLQAAALESGAEAAAPASATTRADTKRIPAAAPAEKTAAPWSVQIAATQDHDSARQLENKLKSQGFDAYIVEADLASGRWYRLRVGRFNARPEADAAHQALLAKANIRGAFVTAK